MIWVPADKQWQSIMSPLLQEPDFEALSQIVDRDRDLGAVFPNENQVFRALDETPLESVRVVILGQDPYHGPSQAEGLSFSVPAGIRLPPSLKNIFKELRNDIGCPYPQSGTLLPWSAQGVLLLNSVLTVRANEPGSHARIGWQQLTDKIISAVSCHAGPTVFILWGAYAQKKRALIDLSRHFVQESVHPSPLSAHGGFFGSKPFSRANQFLSERGRGTIDWQL